jgi:hypothetical protein
MKAWEKWIMEVWPWIALIMSGLLYSFILPEHTNIQAWIFNGLEVISYPVWFLSGGLLGMVLSVVWTRWPKSIILGARRIALVIFAYIGVAIVIALFTGEGEGIERIGNSGPVKAWGFMVWTILSMSPSMMGVLAILKRSKWARGISVLSFIATAAATMIYSQASSATILSQDPFLSILFIWSIIAFVEGLNWRSKYADPGDGKDPYLWRKQAAFTMVFLAAGSLVAYLPHLIGNEFLNTYEGSTILGKAIIGAMVLIPIGVVAIAKGLLDRRSLFR